MASFASSATTCGARKHAWTNKTICFFSENPDTLDSWHQNYFFQNICDFDPFLVVGAFHPQFSKSTISGLQLQSSRNESINKQNPNFHELQPNNVFAGNICPYDLPISKTFLEAPSRLSPPFPPLVKLSFEHRIYYESIHKTKNHCTAQRQKF